MRSKTFGQTAFGPLVAGVGLILGMESATAQSETRDMLPQTYLERQPQAPASVPDADAAQREARKRALDESRRLEKEFTRDKDSNGPAASAATAITPPATGNPLAITIAPAPAPVPAPAPATAPVPAPAPAPAPAVAPTVPRFTAEQLADANRYAARGRDLLASGNLALARGLLERAADLGNAHAAHDLAQTYDPRTVRNWPVVGLVADIERARIWYLRAQKLGAPEATESLKNLPQ